MEYQIGQRWFSEMEPELGLGIITEISARRIHIHFPASESDREYAVATAPIKRLIFNPGDDIKTADGRRHRVTEVAEHNGQLIYICGKERVSEEKLDSVLSFSSPVDRLLSGMYDTNALFELRRRTLEWRARYYASPAFGFLGARMELIPHQLYVANKVAGRPQARVLLSDQVGLGKTIEACLILHRLLLSRRIERALIIVPESLVHQWFVELLRRFNLLFRIFDADYVDSLLEADKERNPFAEEQLLLCSLEFLATKKDVHKDLYSAGWDMVIVDEAHHLHEDTEEYELIARLAAQTPGLMLLTATPEQLGQRSHFARLCLLDPSRYGDYDAFVQASSRYQSIAELANAVLNGEKLSVRQKQLLKSIVGTEADGDADALIPQLIDRYGVGRVVFRNTRAAIPDFPGRLFHFVPLSAPENIKRHLVAEFQHDAGEGTLAKSDFKDDPRVAWLLNFLQSEQSKILLICHSIEKARAIEKALQHHTSAKFALFHEEMTLLQRDRNAAWFADPDGAQLLICSEIGSEGRNFQFAPHLVLFDVPLDPELLEQRIGRLDRIGQKSTINIWAPAVKSTPQEKLIRWYHDGFNAFEKNAVAAYQIFEKFGERVRRALLDNDEKKIETLISETKRFNEKMTLELERGRNRLLEINSFRREKAEALIEHMRSLDNDAQFRQLVLDLLQHFEVQVDELDDDLYVLKTDYLTSHEVPLPPFRSNGIPMTFSRALALAREDVEFFTSDHPTVSGSIDLLLGSPSGSAAVASLPGSSQGLLIEAIFLLECIAPVRLHIDRFFPPMPLRLVIDHSATECTQEFAPRLLNKKLKNLVDAPILENPSIRQELLPGLVRQCESLAQQKAQKIISERKQSVDKLLTAEIQRLRSLQRVNDAISDAEITAVVEERQQIIAAIESARLRLDAIRLIIQGEF